MHSVPKSLFLPHSNISKLSHRCLVLCVQGCILYMRMLIIYAEMNIYLLTLYEEKKTR